MAVPVGSDAKPVEARPGLQAPGAEPSFRPATPGLTRRRLGGATRDDRLNLIGAVCSALSVTFLLFGRVAPFSGLLGFVAVAYVTFLGSYYLLASRSADGPAVRDKLVAVILTSAAAVTFAALVFVILFTIFRGRQALGHLNFYTQDMSRAGPLDPVNKGGIKHALVGTVWMTGIALAITVPLGVVSAVYINEVGGRVSRFVRTIVDAMTALPSVVAGLFIYATWILALGREKSALAAALAISIMMLPISIRASDVVLRLVPGNLREASSALGAPQWRTVTGVVLPTARSGLVTAVILGTARGIGETAPVLFTAGFPADLNTNPTHGPMVSLPLAAFEFIKSPQPAMVQRGFATAAFLLLLVLALFAVARVIGGKGAGQVSPRRARRAQRRSARDVARIELRRAARPQPIWSGE
jgi:phosphate transport system permease protein